MTNYLHIVCLDAPSPPDYGGAIDMYYKIKALHESGNKIILHYFDYKPQRNIAGLQEFCSEMHAYKRENIFPSLPLSRPYIVQSRISTELINRLNQDSYPILLEGLHCSGILPFLTRKERAIVRMHNDEALYYRSLASNEKSFWKKAFFLQESRLLKRYQKSLDKDLPLACLSQSDAALLQKEYGFTNAFFVPCFLPWQTLTCQEGYGTYCLYHGNLSVPENEETVVWLIENVFRQIKVPFVVAGKKASKRLQAIVAKHSGTRLINDPPPDELDALIRDAHIHVLPSLNNTGVKLKLLNALLNGRFCITNQAGIDGSGIKKGVVIKEPPSEWIEAITSLLKKKFTIADKEERKQIIDLYNNRRNAEKLNERWSHYQ